MSNYSYHHVHLLSTDALAAARFYETMFDATFTESKGANGLPRCHVHVGGQLILISTADEDAREPATGPHSQIGIDHIGLRVEDMDEAAAELKERGAEFSVEPREFRPGIRIAFVQGPDGASIELVEYDACRSAIAAKTLEPETEFRVPEESPAARLVDYWQWSGSSLMDNTARGVLAEFLVGRALGLTGEPRREWDGYDLRLPCGKTIEVKSSARIQSWPQKKCSPLKFGIAPRRTSWDSKTGKELKNSDLRRWAHIYVFCTLESRHIHKHRQALDTDQWRFYVVPTSILNEEFPVEKEQKTVTLGSLKSRLGTRLEPCCYSTLAQKILDVARTCRPVRP